MGDIMKVNKMSVIIPNVFEKVLRDTCDKQAINPDKIIYLQPYSSEFWISIKKAFDNDPNPIRVFFSTTKNQGEVSYTALLINISDKTTLTEIQINEIEKYLPNEEEGGVYGLDKERPMKNLLHIKKMKQIKVNLPLPTFTKYQSAESLSDAKFIRYQYARINPQKEEWVKSQIGTPSVTKEDYVAEEGKRYEIESKMLKTKRNRRIVAEAKDRYEAICEACGDNLQIKYDEYGKNYIQFHHREPLSSYPEGKLNSYKDLAPLCPNCHVIIHRTKPIMSVKDFREKVILPNQKG